MDTNLLLLEMHWMNGNCGNMVLKNINLNGVFKMKRLSNALQFVATIVQQCQAFEAGAKHAAHVYLQDRDMRNEWMFQSSFVKGVVRIAVVTMGKESPNDPVPFMWEGAMSDFRNSVSRFMSKLPSYTFFERAAALFLPGRFSVMPNRREVSLG